jgi:hypothetical protein
MIKIKVIILSEIPSDCKKLLNGKNGMNITLAITNETIIEIEIARIGPPLIGFDKIFFISYP